MLIEESSIDDFKELRNHCGVIQAADSPARKMGQIDLGMYSSPVIQREIALAFGQRNFEWHIFKLIHHDSFGSENATRLAFAIQTIR